MNSHKNDRKKTFLINERFEFHVNRDQLVDLQTKRRIKLEPLISNTLLFLIRNRSEVIRRAEIINRFWSIDTYADEALTKAISKLRKELKDDPAQPKCIRTISKVGYEWIGEIQLKEHYAKEVIRKIPVLNFSRRTVTGLLLILMILFVIKSIFLPHH